MAHKGTYTRSSLQHVWLQCYLLLKLTSRFSVEWESRNYSSYSNFVANSTMAVFASNTFSFSISIGGRVTILVLNKASLG